jgi:hypothetical protein
VTRGHDEKVLDLTCDDELWVANALSLGTLAGEALRILGVPELGLAERLRGWVPNNLLGQRLDVNVSGLRYELERQETDVAHVRVYGRIRARLHGHAFAMAVDREHSMVREAGRWRWCGLDDASMAGVAP